MSEHEKNRDGRAGMSAADMAAWESIAGTVDKQHESQDREAMNLRKAPDKDIAIRAPGGARRRVRDVASAPSEPHAADADGGDSATGASGNRQPDIPGVTVVRRPKRDRALRNRKGAGKFGTAEDIVASQHVAMDPKRHKRMVKGEEEPQDRIDLHGKTSEEAERALRSFIVGAQMRGLRLVLVITGKGNRTGDSDGPVPDRGGVLRQQVPQWLTRGSLGGAVLNFSFAHPRHGGDGAYYVYLRRRK